MEFEIVFKGSPAEFAVMAESFGNRLFGQMGEDAPMFSAKGDVRKLSSDTNLVTVLFRGPNSEKTGLGWINGQRLPGDRTLLTITTDDDKWKNLEAFWLLLYEELKRQGWNENNQLEGQTINKEREPKYAPRRIADFNNWVIVWNRYRKWENTGMGPKGLERELNQLKNQNLYHGPIYSTETLSKIIKAGKAGELETQK